MIALDASALLAALFREKGHERVTEVLGDCCISTVNLTEVIGRFMRAGFDAGEALREVLALEVEIVPFETSDAMLTASLLPATHQFGLSRRPRVPRSCHQPRHPCDDGRPSLVGRRSPCRGRLYPLITPPRDRSPDRPPDRDRLHSPISRPVSHAERAQQGGRRVERERHLA